MSRIIVWCLRCIRTCNFLLNGFDAVVLHPRDYYHKVAHRLLSVFVVGHSSSIIGRQQQYNRCIPSLSVIFFFFNLITVIISTKRHQRVHPTTPPRPCSSVRFSLSSVTGSTVFVAVVLVPSSSDSFFFKFHFSFLLLIFFCWWWLRRCWWWHYRIFHIGRFRIISLLVVYCTIVPFMILAPILSLWVQLTLYRNYIPNNKRYLLFTYVKDSIVSPTCTGTYDTVVIHSPTVRCAIQ